MDNNKRKIILTEEETEIAAQTILNAWLKGDQNIIIRDKDKDK